jgi:hypothetical protein
VVWSEEQSSSFESPRLQARVVYFSIDSVPDGTCRVKPRCRNGRAITCEYGASRLEFRLQAGLRVFRRSRLHFVNADERRRAGLFDPRKRGTPNLGLPVFPIGTRKAINASPRRGHHTRSAGAVRTGIHPPATCGPTPGTADGSPELHRRFCYLCFGLVDLPALAASSAGLPSDMGQHGFRASDFRPAWFVR